MPRLFHKFSILAGCSALGAMISCLPPGESGQCLVDEDCTGRGQICDSTNSVCVDTTYDATSTENPAPGTFSNKVIPFFRGQVCTTPSVRSGSTFPVTMTPCFHSCIDVQSFKFKHFFECTGAACDLWALMWVVANGTACPADAFGEFDASTCSFDPAISFEVVTTLDTGPIIGNMMFEIPFITNADMAQLAPTGTENPAVNDIKARMFQYPRDPSRLVNGGMPISLLDQNDLPPASCEDNACTCFNIGY